ncbi:MAG: hypothetical protein V7646_5518 [Pseudonocardia sp.]
MPTTRSTAPTRSSQAEILELGYVLAIGCNRACIPASGGPLRPTTSVSTSQPGRGGVHSTNDW